MVACTQLIGMRAGVSTVFDVFRECPAQVSVNLRLQRSNAIADSWPPAQPVGAGSTQPASASSRTAAENAAASAIVARVHPGRVDGKRLWGPGSEAPLWLTPRSVGAPSVLQRYTMVQHHQRPMSKTLLLPDFIDVINVHHARSTHPYSHVDVDANCSLLVSQPTSCRTCRLLPSWPQGWQMPFAACHQRVSASGMGHPEVLQVADSEVAREPFIICSMSCVVTCTAVVRACALACGTSSEQLLPR
eukprot:366415-Chlamydomonas_euryale.AAC.4